tara:strand:- start:28590 stop:29366 length:777 start_codon:yes stop_codon:yes gene_type:complete
MDSNFINKRIESLEKNIGINIEQLKHLTTNLNILASETPKKEDVQIQLADGTTPGLSTNNFTDSLRTNLELISSFPDFYQTFNSANSAVADFTILTHDTNSGFPSVAGAYVRYNSWKTSGNQTINSNTNVFEPTTYGFKAKVAGTYKVYVHMQFQTSVQNQDVGIRLAKNTLVDDVQNGVQVFNNPGPLSNTTRINGNVGVHAGKVLASGVAQITHILTLAVNDELSVYTTTLGQNHAAGNNCHTREGYSQLLVEYLG